MLCYVSCVGNVMYIYYIDHINYYHVEFKLNVLLSTYYNVI